ncbi:MAG TPA: hypothetical protein VFL89_02295 [Solirubrobacterales bacterium]|nr:hypothetical protein [Solirubrobacterales bacterium]
MAQSASAEEAAAIAAAIERFHADTAPAVAPQGERTAPWQRAALLEGVNAKAMVQDLEGNGGDRWLS